MIIRANSGTAWPIADKTIQTIVTSPPYWGLRCYGVDGQIGQEPSPKAYCDAMVQVFREARRCLKDDGTVWLNIGDSYSSGGRKTQTAPTLRRSGKDEASGLHARLQGLCSRPGVVDGIEGKNLIGVPWRLAFALQDDGWYLRTEVIWHKPNPTPESVRDRPTRAHEYIFLLSKKEKYYYDGKSIEEPIVGDGRFDECWTRRREANGYGAPSGGGATEEMQSDLGFELEGDAPSPKKKSGFRNKRTVWTVPTSPAMDGEGVTHFAAYPPDLIKPCILAGSPVGGIVLDPFAGTGTTVRTAFSLERIGIGLEINPDYARLAHSNCFMDKNQLRFA